MRVNVLHFVRINDTKPLLQILLVLKTWMNPAWIQEMKDLCHKLWLKNRFVNKPENCLAPEYLLTEHKNICCLETRIFVNWEINNWYTELKNICCLEKMEKNFSSPIHDLKDSIRLVDRANKSIKRFPFLVVWMKAIIWKGKIPKHMIFWTRYKGKITRKKGAITKQI